MADTIDLTLTDTDIEITQSFNKENQSNNNKTNKTNKTPKMISSITIPRFSKRHKSSSGITSLTNMLDTTLLPTTADTLNDINALTSTTEQYRVTTRNSNRHVIQSNANTAQTTICNFEYKWTIHDSTLHILHPGNIQCASDKVLAIDMDSTLIKTKSGRTRPINSDDWQWFSDNVCPKICTAYQQNYRIIIISNQSALTKPHTGKVKQDELYKKVLQIVKSPELCHIPIVVFLAGGIDLYRKPNNKLWYHFIQHYNNNIHPNKKFSIFVGDAAGRAAEYDSNSTTKADFNASDRKFALNCNIQFATPDEYFDNKPVAPFKWDIDVEVAKLMEQVNNTADNVTVAQTSITTTVTSTTLTESITNTDTDTIDYHKLHTNQQEMIVFVGSMASGKSSFVKNYLIPYNYVWINQDTLKTRDKCIQQADIELAAGHSVVIDNTNPTTAVRKLYIQVAQKYNVPVRCCYFTTSIKVAQHLNKVRAKMNNKSKYIPAVAFNVYRSKLMMPTLSEKFSEIITVDFKPQFETEEQKKLFNELT